MSEGVERFNIRGVGRQPFLPTQAISAELCKTKDATEKLLKQVRLMRKDTQANNAVLQEILAAIIENNECVTSCMHEMKEGKEQISESQKQMKALEVKGDELKAKLEEGSKQLEKNSDETKKNSEATRGEK